MPKTLQNNSCSGFGAENAMGILTVERKGRTVCKGLRFEEAGSDRVVVTTGRSYTES